MGRKLTAAHRATFLLLGLLLMAPSFPGLSRRAEAQKRGPVERVVQGKVTDQNGKIISGAVVYLKDTGTLGIKSFIAGTDGEYRFGQLSSSTDYRVWAEADGKKSPVKAISSFDSKKQFVMDLKIDTAK